MAMRFYKIGAIESFCSEWIFGVKLKPKLGFRTGKGFEFRFRWPFEFIVWPARKDTRIKDC